jgi:hypothetical protein
MLSEHDVCVHLLSFSAREWPLLRSFSCTLGKDITILLLHLLVVFCLYCSIEIFCSSERRKVISYASPLTHQLLDNSNSDIWIFSIILVIASFFSSEILWLKEINYRKYLARKILHSAHWKFSGHLKHLEASKNLSPVHINSAEHKSFAVSPPSTRNAKKMFNACCMKASDKWTIAKRGNYSSQANFTTGMLGRDDIEPLKSNNSPKVNPTRTNRSG